MSTRTTSPARILLENFTLGASYTVADPYGVNTFVATRDPKVATQGPVTGGPNGNAVIVTGPNAGGPGIDTRTVSNFTVQGRIVAGAVGEPSTPDLVAASDTGKSSTDNLTNSTTPTLPSRAPLPRAQPSS